MGKLFDDAKMDLLPRKLDFTAKRIVLNPVSWEGLDLPTPIKNHLEYIDDVLCAMVFSHVKWTQMFFGKRSFLGCLAAVSIEKVTGHLTGAENEEKEVFYAKSIYERRRKELMSNPSDEALLNFVREDALWLYDKMSGDIDFIVPDLMSEFKTKEQWMSELEKLLLSKIVPEEKEKRHRNAL
jgi:hypothetical protein